MRLIHLLFLSFTKFKVMGIRKPRHTAQERLCDSAFPVRAILLPEQQNVVLLAPRQSQIIIFKER